MRHLKNLALALTLSVLCIGGASAVEVIPTTGIDMAGWVDAGIVAIGTVLAAVVGGFFAFLVIKKAMRWAGRALG